MKIKLAKIMVVFALLVAISVTPVFAASANYLYTKYIGEFLVASYAESFDETGYDRITIDNRIDVNDVSAVSNSADCRNKTSCSTSEIYTLYRSNDSYESWSHHYFWKDYEIKGSVMQHSTL